MNPNYKDLLLKYMQHLHQVEESLFLELINSPFSKIKFNKEELDLLRTFEELIETDPKLCNS